MSSLPAILPSAEFRTELARRGGATASRCYQCATCSAVCELARDDAPFPRRQMLLAQWGLEAQIAADPAVWLCHQCNDCTQRCPRDARPGDVLQAVRALSVEKLAVPKALGRFVGRAATTWPLLLAIPILFWLALLAGTGHLTLPAEFHAYEQVVPHALIYGVFFPVAAWVVLASWVSGKRFWALLGSGEKRSGSFLGSLMGVLGEISTHKRFKSCGAGRSRFPSHLLLFWGFVGAAVTSGLLIVGIYIQKLPMPLALSHPYKILGNLSAVLLVVGGGWLVASRLGNRTATGNSTAFDTYFLTVVALVIVTGVLAEVARLALPPEFAVAVYITHLGVVLNLFITFPYSKFAHLLYRSLAMVHQRMVEAAEPTHP
ncbi:MAG: quinone-interacting membrane-bound oxidoreductase complex subunit QmoC [Acidithiobacillales bacterium]